VRKSFLWLCVTGLLLVSQPVSADLISGSGAWQSWTLSDLNRNGHPSWDNGSSDGTQKNTGYYLTGTRSYFSSLPGYKRPEAIPCWGTGSGGFDTGFSFTKNISYSNAGFIQAPNTYWIGIKDLLGEGKKDHNDMVIKVSSAPVPEPATMLLLGFGLLGLASFGRKKVRR
jgi:hypothetical protein